MKTLKIDKFVYQSTHAALTNLSNDKIFELLQRYYAEETESLLKVEFDIKYDGELSMLFPIYEISNCRMCRSKNWISLYTREDVKKYGSYAPSDSLIYCKKCGHVESIECQCDALDCIAERKMKIDEEKERVFQWEKIQKICLPEYQDIKMDSELTLEERLYLGLFIKACQNNKNDLLDLEHVWKDQPPTPTYSLFMYIVDYLIKRNLIVPSIESPKETFYFTEVGEVEFVENLAIYWVNVKQEREGYEEFVVNLIYPKYTLFYTDKDFCFEIWKRIGIAESVNYMEQRFKRLKFEFIPGKREYQLFTYLIDHYSIKQIFYIIHRITERKAGEYLEGDIEKEGYQNQVIQYCENFSKNAVRKNWDITYYQRNTPESHMTSMVFNDVLGIGDLAYEVVPTKDL